MNIEELKQKYAAISGKVITSRRDNFFKLESNKPVTFYILLSEYSSRGVWIHPIATHFLGRRYGCSNITDPNSCYICEQLLLLEEELAVLKGECEEKQKTNPHEAQALAVQITEFEKRIQSARAQEKYAFNILVKGEEIPRIFEAPKSVAGPIVQVFETVLAEENINIFEPTAATAFTVSKEGENLLTRYKVITSPRPAPILTGEDREARIAKVIAAGFNLDERYKLPTTTELRTAWENYLNGTDQQPQQQTSYVPSQTHSAPTASTARGTVGPVSMSRIGGRTVPTKPVTAAPVAEEPTTTNGTEVAEEEEPVKENNGSHVTAAATTNPPPATTPLKPNSDLVKSDLLGRLKAASVKR
jgi:hypothetical protein